MSIFDGDQNPRNLTLPTMGGPVFWADLAYGKGYRLQQNRVTGHCRILDHHNVRVAWGEEGPMRAKLRRLWGDQLQLQCGDVVGVHRAGSIYDHYGVYESDSCVYEYASQDGDFGDVFIHTSSLKKFVGDSGKFFILVFPERHGVPGKLAMRLTDSGYAFPDTAESNLFHAGILQTLTRSMESAVSSAQYHLYSPEETIQRARKRLGERQYNLIENNCEHFALWCKTGMTESHQVNEFLKVLRTLLPFT